MKKIRDELFENDPLRRGRHPCAVADFDGEQEEIGGKLCFYDTPVGIVMTAELCCPKQENPITPYRLCLGECKSRANLALPVLYARNGRIWARVVTGRLDLREATRRPVLLCALERGIPRVLGCARWRDRTAI